jgi:hypothetical protein
MSPSSHWTLFIARPGRDRQHVIRDPQGEPRLIFSEDDGTRINDRLARYLVESLNAGLDVEDPNPEEGWFLDRPEDGDEQDPAIPICDPDFEIRLEILDTENPEEDQALGQKVVALINTYFIQTEVSHPSASVIGSYRDGLGDLEPCRSLAGLFGPIHDRWCFNCTQAGSIRPALCSHGQGGE